MLWTLLPGMYVSIRGPDLESFRPGTMFNARMRRTLAGHQH